MATNDVLTLAEGYEAINNPQASGHDGTLGIWITAVSQRLDKLCGPVVVRTVTDDAYDGGELWLPLRHAPGSPSSATTITSVKEYDGTTLKTLTAETNASKPADGYLFEQELGTLWRRSGGADSRFPVGRRNVLVTYEAGRYPNTAAVGDRFKFTATSILRRLWAREAGAWATGGNPFEDTAQVGFFRAMSESLITEFLADELKVI